MTEAAMLPSGDLAREEDNIPDRLFPDVDLSDVEWSCSVERVDPPMHTYPRIGRIHVLGQVLKIINDEHKLTKEYIGQHCGGHRYRLNLYVPKRKLRGPYKHDKITCPGDPAFPSPEYIQRQVAAGKMDETVLLIAGQGIGGHVGGNGAGLPVSAAESNLASKVVTTAEQRAEKLQQANDKLQSELREKAAKEAEVSARLAALEQQLKVEQGHRAVEPELQRNTQEHERGMLGIIQAANKSQIESIRTAADARIAALETQANRRDVSEAKAADAATAPLRQFMEDQGARHAAELAATETRHESMLKLFKESNDSALKMVTATNKATEQLQAQRMDDYRDELKILRAEKSKSVKDQVTELAALFAVMKELTGTGGGEEKSDMAEKILEGFTEAAPHLSGIITALGTAGRHLITGQPVAQMGGFTAQLAGQGTGQPGVPQPDPELTPEQQAAAEEKTETERRNTELAQEIERVLDALVSGMQRDTPAPDLASYLLTKHERAAMQLAAISQPEDINALVAQVQQRRPPLASVTGDKYIREVLEAVRGRIN